MFPVAGLHGKVAVGNAGLWMAFQLHCAHVESSRAAERRGGAIHSEERPLVTRNGHPGGEGSMFGKPSCLCRWGQVSSPTIRRPQTTTPGSSSEESTLYPEREQVLLKCQGPGVGGDD